MKLGYLGPNILGSNFFGGLAQGFAKLTRRKNWVFHILKFLRAGLSYPLFLQNVGSHNSNAKHMRSIALEVIRLGQFLISPVDFSKITHFTDFCSLFRICITCTKLVLSWSNTLWLIGLSWWNILWIYKIDKIHQINQNNYLN